MHTYALRSLHVGGLELGWEVAQVELQSARVGASGHDAKAVRNGATHDSLLDGCCRRVTFLFRHGV